MESGKLFAILGGILTILGTYIFAMYGVVASYAGSGIGFILNIPTLFSEADTIGPALYPQIWIYYVVLIIFIIFLAAGVLQIACMSSKALSFFFSLFPLGIGLWFLILTFIPDLLGYRSYFFLLVFGGDHFGSIFPFIINLGDAGLGIYLTLAGGVLGFISVFMEH
jgi:hypothetical protein